MSLHLKRIAEVLRNFYSALATILRYPLLFGLFAGDCVIGVPATFYVAFQFGAVYAIAFFLLIQSWLIYSVIKKIREENAESKIMKEGWEGRTDTEKVIEKYLKLIEEDK